MKREGGDKVSMKYEPKEVIMSIWRKSGTRKEKNNK
jgi:hypothetical protein